MNWVQTNRHSVDLVHKEVNISWHLVSSLGQTYPVEINNARDRESESGLSLNICKSTFVEIYFLDQLPLFVD